MRNKRFKAFERLNRWIAVCFCIAVLLAAKSSAQTAGTGNIQGVVTDSTGALIQHATVTATNTAMQVKHTAATDTNGLYSFPQPAHRQLHRRSNGSGVQASPADGCHTRSWQQHRHQYHDERGAEPTRRSWWRRRGFRCKPKTVRSSRTIDQNTLTEMPLNGRQMTSLITLTGGAVNANENNDESGSKTFYSSAVISIGGGQGNATDYRLDGGDNNDYMTNVNMPFPFRTR